MLTDTKARTAKPRQKPYKLADENSLSLLISPSGSKLWRWNYAYDGKHKTMAFGTYPYQARRCCERYAEIRADALLADGDEAGFGFWMKVLDYICSPSIAEDRAIH